MATEDKEPTKDTAPDVATPRAPGEPAPYHDEAVAPAPGAPAGDAADQAAPDQAAERDAPQIDRDYPERSDAAVEANQEARRAAVAGRPAEAHPDMQLVTQEQELAARQDHTPVRDEAAHAAARANEAAALEPGRPRNPPSASPEEVRLDQAPVRDEDAVHIDPALDDRIPVNARAMLTGDLPRGTETCWNCGHEKPRPERPGRDKPEEFCPYCGKGSQAEQE